jgi:hypothetical protein
VSVGISTSAGSTVVTNFQRIEAGETFHYRLDPSALTKLKWKANSAAVKIDQTLNED